jgi:tetratricopeptide (TPR) repeat protein
MNAENSNKKVDVLLSEANTARRENNYEKAKQGIILAVDLARRLSKVPLLVKALNDLARIERDLGNTATSIKCYEELANLCEKHNDPSGVAHALRHLGDIHLEEGQLEDAENYYEEALRIYNNLKPTPPLDLANTLRGYALLLEKQGDFQESLECWKKARTIYEEQRITPGVEESNRWIKKLQ